MKLKWIVQRITIITNLISYPEDFTIIIFFSFHTDLSFGHRDFSMDPLYTNEVVFF